jgi:LPS-assembly lipoprotein
MSQRPLLAGLVLATVLTGCGFHLRGTEGTLKPLPFTKLYLASPQSQIHPALVQQFRFRPDVTLSSTAGEADAILTVTEERSSKEVLTINRSGKVNDYELSYRATARLTVRGEAYGNPMTILARRELSYVNNQVLGKEQEEQLLYRDMQQDAAGQIVRRLSVLKPAAATPAAAP